jgi:hypothetical protein
MPPSCGASQAAGQGDRAGLLSRLQILPKAAGLDLDGDGRPDNNGAGLASLLNYDLRFLTQEQLDFLCWRSRKGATVAPHTNEEAHGIVYVPSAYSDEARSVKVELRPLVCQREQPAYRLMKYADRPPWLALMDGHFSEARVKCGKCPHRGLPLESLPREPGTDIVICRGHGLRWDLKTGELVREWG